MRVGRWQCDSDDANMRLELEAECRGATQKTHRFDCVPDLGGNVEQPGARRRLDLQLGVVEDRAWPGQHRCSLLGQRPHGGASPVSLPPASG